MLVFADGQVKKLITKPKIGGFGMNWQHCSHVLIFPSHSYEQYYQCIRRCWRFGQKNKVKVDIVISEGEVRVMKNLRRKSNAADKMFASLIQEMNNPLVINKSIEFTKREEIPTWL